MTSDNAAVKSGTSQVPYGSVILVSRMQSPRNPKIYGGLALPGAKPQATKLKIEGCSGPRNKKWARTLGPN